MRGVEGAEGRGEGERRERDHWRGCEGKTE